MKQSTDTTPQVFDLLEERNHVIRTDPHSHILPGIDDGSKSLEMSLRMARRAEALGIQSIVTTPHACHPANKTCLDPDGYRARVSELNTVLQQNDISVQLYPGMEYLMNEKIPERFEAGELLTWADQGRYVLIELGFHHCPDCTWPVLDYFDSLGITPIIAHPERYTWLPKRMELVQELIERNFFLQINIMSINGLWGRTEHEMALKILSLSPRWLVGTDAHSDADKFWGIEDVRAELLRAGVWQEQQE